MTEAVIVPDVIHQAVALVAEGFSIRKAADALDVPTKRISFWQHRHREVWDDLLAETIDKLLLVVRSSVMTDAILEEPDRFLRMATAADKWCQKRNESLFQGTGQTTLLSFFESYYRPTCLVDVSANTMHLIKIVLRRWRLLTGDPPLAAINTEMLVKFRECLMRSRGQKPYERMSPVTVGNFLRYVQMILDKAGPKGARNRDAAGILGEVPWTRPPRPDIDPPRIVSDQRLSDVYLAAVCMTAPNLPGIKPPLWWQTLLVVTHATALRRRSLFAARMGNIDWNARTLLVPGGAIKSRRGMVVYLNDAAMVHLRKMRTNREKLFPWPFSKEWFDKSFHHLQYEAGIPEAEHFGLHEIRKTVATKLWQVSPEAARLLLGHSRDDVTRKHYVNGENIITRGVNAIPQPAAFTRT
ncbi:MAG: site-specific integrase [Planctomycetia bacterium]|nr:site-specific integrase [Planctomycetia bacterium]